MERNLPTLTEGALFFLKHFVSKNHKILEFGSGVSTKWFGENAKEVISLEHNPEWHNKTTGLIDGLENVNLILHEANVIDRTDLIDSCYTSEIEHLEDETFDFILIDGRNRVNCFLKSERLLKKGGVIMLDNSEREEYSECFEFYSDKQLIESSQTRADQFGFSYPNWKTSWWIK